MAAMPMRTAGQCLVKAAEMERVADNCSNAAVAAGYENLAVSWRRIARQAARQGNWTVMGASES
jgi:hypothetical protein